MFRKHPVSKKIGTYLVRLMKYQSTFSINNLNSENEVKGISESGTFKKTISNTTIFKKDNKRHQVTFHGMLLKMIIKNRRLF